MDFSRLRTGEIVAGLGGIALIAVMFLDWFAIPPVIVGGSSVTAIPGVELHSTGIDAWKSLEFIDFCLLLTGLVAVKAAGVRAWGKRPRFNIPFGAVVCAFGGLALVLILWRILDPPSDGSLKAGIFLGLAAAAAILGGGYWSAREDGFDFYEDDRPPRTTRSPAKKRAAKR